MSNSRALNTISQYALFGAAAGSVIGGLDAQWCKDSGGRTELCGVAILIGISAGLTAGFLLGMAKALFDECYNPQANRTPN